MPDWLSTLLLVLVVVGTVAAFAFLMGRNQNR